MSMIKREKGKNMISFPNEYVMIDIETTGLSSEWDDILEIGALKVKNNEIIDSFQSFVACDYEIPEEITALTGITNEMLVGAPDPAEAIKNFSAFLGDSIIIGYNVNFDINFLYDYSEKYLGIKIRNDYVDCMRIARKLFPDEPHHRLKDMIKLFNISINSSHRAIADCEATKQIYDKLYQFAIDTYGNIEEFCNVFSRKKYYELNAGEIKTNKTEFDISHPLFGKVCVFTGKLEKMERRNAMQIVADFGGIPDNNVTRRTNYLILGNNDYCTTIKGGKSTKQKKAEELISKGSDLIIITENDFYDLIISYGEGEELKLKTNSDVFGCCSKYKECSDAKKCLRTDDRANACLYRKNLENGKIFY
ncbi:MAG: ribonuclease H-like domain-containing protein [Ruminococcus sp.]|nr:ribonuclease H-like domain-containing protein [Ruminococcus sp.]